MSMSDRCDEIIRLIDQVLAESSSDNLPLRDHGSILGRAPLTDAGAVRR